MPCSGRAKTLGHERGRADGSRAGLGRADGPRAAFTYIFRADVDEQEAGTRTDRLVQCRSRAVLDWEPRTYETMQALGSREEHVGAKGNAVRIIRR